MAVAALQALDAIADMHDFIALIAEALDQGLRQLSVILGQQQSHSRVYRQMPPNVAGLQTCTLKEAAPC